jgi:16S rRNA (uracil1498-N3)-methyltransferase
MSDRRFLHKDIDQPELVLDAGASHHAIEVLRLKKDDTVELFDGQGRSIRAVIVAADPRATVLKPISEPNHNTHSQVELNIISALPKQQRLKFMIQKLCELGISTFTPLKSERSVVTIPEERGAKKFERWEKIAVQAARQSRQNRLTGFSAQTTIRELSNTNTDIKLVLSPDATCDIYSALEKAECPTSIAIVIGPEGGLSPTETEHLQAAAFTPVSLALPVLRVETAAIVVAGIVGSYPFGR